MRIECRENKPFQGFADASLISTKAHNDTMHSVLLQMSESCRAHLLSANIKSHIGLLVCTLNDYYDQLVAGKHCY